MATIRDITVDINAVETLEALALSPHHKDSRKGVEHALRHREKQLKKERERHLEYQDMLIFEKSYPAGTVAGIDEAGRGPLAGEVVAAAVILPEGFYLPGLDDSKKLSEATRLRFREEIMQHADHGIGIAGVGEIDTMNIYEATRLAMRRAVDQLDRTPAHLLIDAMELDSDIPQTPLVKGDSRSASIAAASVLAKTARDTMMADYDKRYPGYDFARNKGYGTKTHLAGIDRYGISDIHRRSFEPVKGKITGN